jgi:two-component system LytT family response regulator
MIRVMLAEDEPHARSKLRDLIQGEPDLELVGECADGLEALRLVAAARPDLLFLDIQMPGLSGVELVRSLEPGYAPCIIVTTAYSEHAVWAFDANVVDYLLKPYDKARFRRALHRTRLAMHDAGRINGAPARPGGRVAWQAADTLKMKVGTRIKFITAGKILYMQAQGDYLQVNTVDEEFLVRERIKNMEDVLDGACFKRVHRSVLLNLNYIKEMKAWMHGDYEFTMQDGAMFRSSATYRDTVRAMVKRA